MLANLCSIVKMMEERELTWPLNKLENHQFVGEKDNSYELRKLSSKQLHTQFGIANHLALIASFIYILREVGAERQRIWITRVYVTCTGWSQLNWVSMRTNQVIVPEGNCVKGKERVMFLAPLTKIFQLQFCRHRSLSPWIYTTPQIHCCKICAKEIMTMISH